MISNRLIASVGLGALVALSACGSSDSSSSSSAGGGSTGSGSGSSTSSAAFNVDTSQCQDPAAATAKLTGTLKVGWSAPLSGPLTQAVGAVLSGMQARFDQVNAAGGIGGVKLSIVKKDDAFNPAKAKANVDELIQSDKVDVLDTFGSGQVNATADAANANCVPELFTQASSPTYRDVKNFLWVTEYLPSSDVEMAVVVQGLVAKYPSGATVGIAENQTESGKAITNGFKKAVQGTKLTIVAEASLTDPNAAATAMQAANPKVLVDAGVTTDCLALSTAVGRTGWKPETFIQPSNCVDGKTLYAPAGAAANGQQVMVWLKNPASPLYASDPDVKAYLAALSGSPIATNSYTVNGWVLGDLMVDTFTKAAATSYGLSHAGIIAAARTQDYHPPMFINGINWKMSATESFGILAFRPFTWDATAQQFQPAGDVIDVSSKYGTGS